MSAYEKTINKVALGIVSAIFFTLFVFASVTFSFSRLVDIFLGTRGDLTPLTAELLLVGVFVALGIWYAKSPPKWRATTVLPVIGGAIAGVIIMYSVVTWHFLENTSRFTHQVIVNQANMKAESPLYVPLMTTIFDKAETTNVRSDIDTQYGEMLANGSYAHASRQPVYFVRLKDGKFQKLFQSGELKNEVIDTAGERMVEEMLKGKRPVAEYPQYTCCGGDDFYPDVPLFRHFLPQRRYLQDFPSELEIVSLVYDDQGKTLGARVRLHGD